LQGKGAESRELDTLIAPMPETTLLETEAISHELGQLLGLSVEVLMQNALPDSLRLAVVAEARTEFAVDSVSGGGGARARFRYTHAVTCHAVKSVTY
jgi:hypothetical protein